MPRCTRCALWVGSTQAGVSCVTWAGGPSETAWVFQALLLGLQKSTSNSDKQQACFPLGTKAQKPTGSIQIPRDMAENTYLIEMAGSFGRCKIFQKTEPTQGNNKGTFRDMNGWQWSAHHAGRDSRCQGSVSSLSTQHVPWGLVFWTPSIHSEGRFWLLWLCLP